MSREGGFRYEFPAGLPVSGVAPGTNLLVSGPSPAGARQVALELLTTGSEGEATLVVSADESGRELLDRLDDPPRPLERSMLGVVDCVGSADDDRRFPAHTRPISHPGDLSAIEVELSILYEKLVARDPAGVRVGLVSLSALLAHGSFREVSRFFHMLTGRVIATDDLGVFLLDSTVEDRETVETMRHYCDAHLQVRAEDGALELRATGLDAELETWSPVEFLVASEGGESRTSP